jgi:hypothetical protein
METKTKAPDRRPFVRVPAKTRDAIELVARDNGWTYAQTVAEAIKRAYGLGPGAAGCRSLRIATDGRTKWARGPKEPDLTT